MCGQNDCYCERSSGPHINNEDINISIYSSVIDKFIGIDESTEFTLWFYGTDTNRRPIYSMHIANFDDVSSYILNDQVNFWANWTEEKGYHIIYNRLEQ
jgi:hypothetical protein